MRQLGLLEGSNIFGDEVPQGKQPTDPFRTKLGEIKKMPLKAIGWYIKEHGLKLQGSSAYPVIQFELQDGNEQGVYIEEIVQDYEARDRRNRNA